MVIPGGANHWPVIQRNLWNTSSLAEVGMVHAVSEMVVVGGAFVRNPFFRGRANYWLAWIGGSLKHM